MLLSDIAPRLLPLPSLLDDQDAEIVDSLWKMGVGAVACLAFGAVVGGPLGGVLASFAILFTLCAAFVGVTERREIAKARAGLSPLLGHQKAIQDSLVPVSDALIKIIARDLVDMSIQGTEIAPGPWSGRVTWQAGPEGLVPKGIAIHAEHVAPQDTASFIRVPKHRGQDFDHRPTQVGEGSFPTGPRPKTGHTRALTSTILEQVQGIGGFDGRMVPWANVPGMESADVRRKLVEHFKACKYTTLLRCVLPVA